jgi:hypothetical protein
MRAHSGQRFAWAIRYPLKKNCQEEDMKQFLRRTVWTPIALLALAAPLAAQKNLTEYVNGPHYNLNIIGVDEGKTATMTGSNRHTIFVGLGRKNNPVTSRT